MVPMRLEHRIEHYVWEHRGATVQEIAHEFAISERRCLTELATIAPFGLEVTDDGRVALLEEPAL